MERAIGDRITVRLNPDLAELKENKKDFGNIIDRTKRLAFKEDESIEKGGCVVETEVGGFALMERMAGWDRVILVDSIQFDGVAPGTLVRLEPQDLRTSLRIRSIHDIDLPTALKLGRCLGFQMPEEVLIWGIQAQDAWTLGETMTPVVGEAMKAAVDRPSGHQRSAPSPMAAG